MTDPNGAEPGSRYRDRRDRKKRPASLEFPEDLYETLRILSVHGQRSIAATVRVAIREFAERNLPSPKAIAEIKTQLEVRDAERAEKKAARIAFDEAANEPVG